MARNKPKLFNRARIIVTGAAGFIGSALIHALNKRGINDIIAVDQLAKDEKWRNLVPLRFADYMQSTELMAALEASHLGRIDYIFHLGACSSTTETDAEYLISNNYRYTQTLADWALTNNSRFVYASSAATYGDGAQGMDDNASDLSAFRPLNLYGYSKHLFDLYAQREGFLNEIIGIKYFNVFGPNEYHKGDMRSLVCKAYHQIVETGKIRLFKSYRSEFADGEQMRDFVYVRDAVEMTIHLAESRKARGLFNVGSGVARKWVDLGRAIFAALDREPKIEFIDMPESIREQYQYHTCADISKIRATGYDADTTSLEEAVRDYVVNYLSRGARLGDHN